MGVGGLLLVSGCRYGRLRDATDSHAGKARHALLAYAWLRTQLQPASRPDATARAVFNPKQIVVSTRGIAMTWHHRALVLAQ